MLVKFFPRGVGKGSGPVQYITRLDSPNTGQLREPAPEIIRGNPELTTQLIDGLDFQYKYNSGVLSFATEDAPPNSNNNQLSIPLKHTPLQVSPQTVTTPSGYATPTREAIA